MISRACGNPEIYSEDSFKMKSLIHEGVETEVHVLHSGSYI